MEEVKWRLRAGSRIAGRRSSHLDLYRIVTGLKKMSDWDSVRRRKYCSGIVSVYEDTHDLIYLLGCKIGFRVSWCE